MSKQIKYEYIPHIISIQNDLEQKFTEEFFSGNYTLSNPLVKLNPYAICPLTAMVMFETRFRTEVTITVKGKEAAGDISHTFPAQTCHILPVYGLYADYDNTVEIILSDNAKNTIHIQTEPLHPEVPAVASIKTTAGYMGENLMFLTAAMRAMPVGYDYAGDIRWYATKNFAFDMKRIDNGHILIGTERLVKLPYNTSGIYEMAMSGKIFKEYQLEGGYHHDQFQMEDGNFLVLTCDFYSGTVEDMCVLIDAKTGEVLRSWDYKDILPQYPVAGSGSQDEHDWFHNNAIWYDKKTNTLTLSGRHQDAIINIDYETGKLNWIIGDPEGWPQDMADKYFFTPVGEEFDWQYEQHACIVLPDGNILVFDNGHFRAKSKEKYIKNSKNFSRGVRYRIDTEKMEIKQIWQYGKERGAEFFSPYIGNVEYYGEGHYMVHSGGIGYENGKICDGFAVTRAMSPKHKDSVFRFNSITCELKDNVLMYELEVPANFYRAEKLTLYYADETAELGKGEILGNMVETKKTRMKIRAEEANQLVPEHYGAQIVEEEDRLTFSATFESGEMAQLLLAAEDGTISRYPIDTVAKNFQAMCVGTFQKADPRSVDVFINKRGLSGQYKIKLVAGEKLYETGVTIQA